VIHHAATIVHPGGSDPETPADITALAWSKDSVLAVGTFSGIVALYLDGKEIAKSPAFSAPVVSLAFSFGDPALLLVGVADGNVSVLGKEKTEAKWTLEGGDLLEAVWIDDSRIVAAVGKNAYILEVSKTDTVKLPEAHGNVTGVSVHSKQGNFYVADSAGWVSIYDKTGRLLRSGQVHRSGICSICWAEMPDVYACGGAEGWVKMVRSAEVESIVALDGGHWDTVHYISFDPIGRYIASTDGENISIWDVSAQKLAISYRSVKCPVVTLQWSPNGRFLGICLMQGQVALIDFEQIC
jgi:WD40 repeat protein